jgi:hypothetical protein
MSVCPPDVVHLVDLQSVQIEDPQSLLSRRQCNDIFTSLDVERQFGLPNQVHSLVG